MPPLPPLPIHHALSAGQDTPSHGSLLSPPPIPMLVFPPKRSPSPPLSVPHHAPIYHQNRNIFGASSLARSHRKRVTPVAHRRLTLTLSGHCTQSLRCSFVFVFYYLPPPTTSTIIIPCHVFTKNTGRVALCGEFCSECADSSSWNHENVRSNKGFLNPNQKKSGDLSLLGASVRNTPQLPLALCCRRLQAVSVCSPALWL